jgi:hypothetical protein
MTRHGLDITIVCTLRAPTIVISRHGDIVEPYGNPHVLSVRYRRKFPSKIPCGTDMKLEGAKKRSSTYRPIRFQKSKAHAVGTG